MNRGCQALSLISRCRNAFRPALPSRGLLQQCSIAYKHQRDLCSDNESYESRDEFPKIPIESPMQFGFDSLNKMSRLAKWAISENLEPESFKECIEASPDVIQFITERLSEEDYKTLEEKFLPDVLEKARNIVSNIPIEERKDLIFDSNCSSFSKIITSCPWQFYSEHPYVVIGHFGLSYTTKIQVAWQVSLQILRDGNSFSEEFTVCHFDYEKHVH